MSTAEILIKGRNRKILFDKFAKRDICIYKIKNIDQKSFIVTIDAKDSQKVFTICGDMWYNKLIKLNGLKAVFNWIKLHFILCIGIVALFFIAYLFDDVLIDVEVNGVSTVSEIQILEVIEECGIKKFARFSTFDFEIVKSKLLSISNDFAYVTVQKSGNKLIINISERVNENSLKDYSRKQIVSSVSGKVVKASVYRGKLLKNIGDFVNVGEVLIDGIFTFNEEDFSTFAFGKVTIEVSYTYEYNSQSDLDREKAIALAKFYCGEDESKLFSVDVKPFGSGYIYTVILNYYVECGG